MIKNNLIISDRLYKVAENIKEGLGQELIGSIKTGKINYLDISVSDNSKLSYITDDRLARFDGDFWNLEKREKLAYHGKVGKVLGKANINLDHNLQVKLQAVLGLGDLDFEILEGEDIYKGYNSDYTNTDSCMTDMQPEVFDIYYKNAKMLVLWEEGKIIGRAILWENVKVSRSTNQYFDFIDRIYGTDQVIQLFKLYAENNGLYSKVEQSFNNSSLELNEEHIISYEKELESFDTEYAPYMDSLKYLNLNTLVLSNNSDGVLLNKDTGYLNQGTWCDECDQYHDEEEVRYIDSTDRMVCDDCIDELYIECDVCGEYHLKDDMTEVEGHDDYLCEYCVCNGIHDYVIDTDGYLRHLDDVIYCEHCCEYHDNENTVYIESEDINVCECCLDDNYELCADCQEYHKTENLTEIEHNGEDKNLCDTCLDNYAECVESEKWFKIENMTYIEAVDGYISNAYVVPADIRIAV